MDCFQIHKQKLVFEDSNQTYAINDTPFDRRLRAAYEAIDKDGMEIRLDSVENDYLYRTEWYDFLTMVYKVRDIRTQRFNNICMNLHAHCGICYQIKNSEWFAFNEIEGLWFIIRGDIWKNINPNICINNDSVSDNDVVFLQFQNLNTYDFEEIYDSWMKSDKYREISNRMYEFVRKRYLSFDDIRLLLSDIPSGTLVQYFTTIAILNCNNKQQWRPKKYVYYFNTDIPGQMDGKLEFTDSKLTSILRVPKKSTNALQRTLFLTNEDCEKYCSLVRHADSKPYAFNASYVWYGYYSGVVDNLEFTYSQYSKYIQMDIENLCVT
jgi:hypothetical protein